MALDKWKPKKAERAGGYFVVKDFTDKDGKPVRRYGGVFFKREDDAKKHCDIVNAIAEEKHAAKTIEKKNERRKRNGKVRNA